MSKEGLPDIEAVKAEGLTVAVITATWNSEICDQLHRRAVEKGRECGAKVDEYRVVGAVELGVVAARAAELYDAVVAGGCVVQGGTPHFDYVCDSVTQALTQIALDTKTPVGNAVLTVHTQEQAYERAGFADSTEDKGAEAMVAALHTAAVLRTMVARG